MADGASGTGAAGSGGAGGGTSGGQSEGGTAPAQQGGGGSGGGSPSVVHGGQGQGIPLDVLPEGLRGKSAAEIKFVLHNMIQTAQATADQNRQLKEKLKGIEAGEGKPPSPGRGKGKGKATAGEDDDDTGEKPLEELILDDPEEAISRVIMKRFGKDLSSLQEGFGESMFHSMRGEIPDFREHEDTIRELLKESNLSPTKENLMGAYLMSVGQKTVEERRQRQQQSENIEGGGDKSGGAAEQTPKRTLTPLQKEIATGMGLTEDEYIEQQEKWENKSFDIKVPTGKP